MRAPVTPPRAPGLRASGSVAAEIGTLVNELGPCYLAAGALGVHNPAGQAGLMLDEDAAEIAWSYLHGLNPRLESP